MSKKQLRTGFTTGSAAAAGAKAGTLALGGQEPGPAINTPLPNGKRLMIPVHKISKNGHTIITTIVKDGGDDPDATHLAKIQVKVQITDPLGQGLEIRGGPGVGRVTRPGLPVDVGEPAINPAPRRQICQAVREAREKTGLQGNIQVTISVPNGETIARKTLNPRLGIIGGISILGTRGTVTPFSHKAYEATITSGLRVAKAAGLSYIAFSTGGRSEKFLTRLRPELAEVALIQVADFFAFSIQEASKYSFRQIYYSCFFGKLVKMALGYAYTHARDNSVNFQQLSSWARKCGLHPELCATISQANTARQILEMIKDHPQGKQFIEFLLQRALLTAQGFSQKTMLITLHLFDFNGMLLAQGNNLQTGRTNR